MGKLAVVAVGGNSLTKAGQRGTIPEQFANSRETSKHIADMLEHGYDIVVTHGNGPQVGNILLRAEMASTVLPPLPLDTCGAVVWERYERALPLLDMVLYDLKIFDAGRHQTGTGVDNDRILENARRIAAAGIPMWIRTPIIPGYTSDAANITALGDFIAGQLPTVERWDLLAYTNLGQPKYHRLDRPYSLEGVALLTRAEMESLHTVARQQVPTAVWSGATRAEEA